MSTEEQALDHLAQFRAWLQAWRQEEPRCQIVWKEFRWRKLGRQTLPLAVVFDEPKALATFVGQEHHWQLGVERLDRLAALCPDRLPHTLGIVDALLAMADADFEILLQLLAWVQKHPDSNLYLRQVPVAGMHSKWIEEHSSLLLKLVNHLLNRESSGVVTAMGLRPLPAFVSCRILDPMLRRQLGGIAHLTTTIEELNNLDLAFERAFIVENRQTALAFQDIEGALVIMGLGYHVESLGRIGWLRNIPCFYWGDIDTHGLAILGRARRYLPHLRSLLMDKQTFLKFSDQWVYEGKPTLATVDGLHDDESQLLADLQNNRWGTALRLEQERVEWNYAWRVVGGFSLGD